MCAKRAYAHFFEWAQLFWNKRTRNTSPGRRFGRIVNDPGLKRNEENSILVYCNLNRELANSGFVSSRQNVHSTFCLFSLWRSFRDERLDFVLIRKLFAFWPFAWSSMGDDTNRRQCLTEYLEINLNFLWLILNFAHEWRWNLIFMFIQIQ